MNVLLVNCSPVRNGATAEIIIASESWDRLGGMSSRISTLNVIDALFTALLNTNYDRYIHSMVDTCVNNRKGV